MSNAGTAEVGRLEQKVAIVTGGGSGIGRETALTFAGEGARVAVVDRAADDGQETAGMIRDRGGDAIFIEADISVSAHVEDMARRVAEHWGRIDILHNNAGISMSPTSIESIEDSFFDKIIAVNLRSVFLGAKHVVPYMKRQGSGVILNTGSASGIRPRPGASAYSASKGAVIAFSKSLALELAPFGIRVLSINPFSTDTPMLQEQNVRASPQEQSARIAAIPLGRLLTASDVARAAAFLVSDDAAMVTGTAFEIDGGRLV